MKHIEFRVRPVTRYNLTRYESGDNSGSVCTVAEFPNWDAAHEVALALQAGAPGAIYTPAEAPQPEETKPAHSPVWSGAVEQATHEAALEAALTARMGDGR